MQVPGGNIPGARRYKSCTESTDISSRNFRKPAAQGWREGAARRAAKLRADINGRAACADHAVLFRPLYINVGFSSE